MKKLALMIVGGTVMVGASLELAGCDDSSTSSPPAASSSGTTSSGGSSSGGSSSGGSSSGGSSSGGSSSGNPSGGITLGAADKQDVTPCPNQDLLKDATQFAALKAAMQTGTITYLDQPYNASDADIFKKKCGLEGFWDPTKNVDPIPVPGGGLPQILTIVQQGNAGICSQGFTSGSFGTGEGFPVAGVFRHEFKTVSGGSTYHVRTRTTTSGSAAGKKFSDIPITVPELKSRLAYQVNGTAANHDDLWTAVTNAMNAPAPSAKVDAQDGGTTIYTSNVELICASKQ